MKNILAFLLMLFLSGCNDTYPKETPGDQPTTRFFHTFVTTYLKGERYSVTYADKWFTISLDDETRVPVFSPDLSGTDDQVDDAEFRELSQRNGDTSYNREVTYLIGLGRDCLADNFSKIDVICTNRALDSDHPAGTLLNDRIKIRFQSCAPYIRNRYTGEEWTTYDKLLSELEDNDLTLLSPLLHLEFAETVTSPGPYELGITLTTTEEKTYTLHATFYPL